MTVSAATLRQHLDYSAWATARLLEAAAALSAEERERDFATADKSVLGTLVHTFAGDRVWLARVQGKQQQFITPQDRDFGRLCTAWPEVNRQRAEWAAPLTDGGFLEVVSYQDLQGNPWGTPL